MQFLTTSTFGIAILLTLSSNKATAAELLGCDAVGCPEDQNQRTQCSVGNATLRVLGITNITTSLDKSPITWTIGYNEGKKPGNDSVDTYDRNFYLGTPPSLQLKDTTGCALFFEGVAPSIALPKPKPGPSNIANFTCSDVLKEDCVSDLISQAKSAAKGIDGKDDFCSSLQKSLVDKPPSTCSLVKGSWGAVFAQPLTGDKAPVRTNLTTCRPTTGQNYDVSLVLSNRKDSNLVNGGMAPILRSVAPVMTVFRKGDNTEAYLTCLQMVEAYGSRAATLVKGDAAGTSVPFVSFLTFVAIALVFVF
ncbi:hypothetical protein CC80DRAFT_497560 [Byssothecium circinans]|uniref:Uncharacterized protein n=1 Tax=Byssothecium circinans TaxID=147558 RepID=A0A6A5TCL3_9PLEO|nr:hypothetical protein CC80DRAFT_497560 [Byssothecium circinans]